MKVKKVKIINSYMKNGYLVFEYAKSKGFLGFFVKRGRIALYIKNDKPVQQMLAFRALSKMLIQNGLYAIKDTAALHKKFIYINTNSKGKYEGIANIPTKHKTETPPWKRK